MNVRLSVVIPALDEAPSLAALCDELAALDRVAGPTEWIIVDDGSTDGTAEVLRDLADRHPNLRVVRLRRTFGKAAALAAGFARAGGEWIATLDADLQDDPAEIPRLIDLLARDGDDLAVGWRRRRRDGVGKRLASRIFNLAVSVAGRRRWHDLNCGLKVMRRAVAGEIDLYGGFHRFLPYLAVLRGFRVREVEVAHRPRRHGTSRYGNERVIAALFDLLALLFVHRRPGEAFARLGAALLVLGGVVLGFLAILRLATGSIHSRYPLLVFGVLVSVVGIQLISSGLLGELLARATARDRPPYAVREEYGGDRPREGA
ncbi:MAG: glycosyltransferase [Planctomycetes bacterium]|nr:glycosyltransferase [Planctomycetota bacterium]